MRTLNRVAVYCASSNDLPNHYFDAAREFGRLLAKQGIGLVYGGGKVGLMGVLADAVLQAGGEVIGVIPQKLMDLEVGHSGVTCLEVVADMKTRKYRMMELADAFVALPGGYGTLEEIAEVTTLAQLNYQDKPVGLLNHAGFWDHLLAWYKHASKEGFIRPIHRDLVLVEPHGESLLQRLVDYEIPTVTQWAEFDPFAPSSD
jgi:uncharacterized protein (TIGR00730 family)